MRYAAVLVLLAGLACTTLPSGPSEENGGSSSVPRQVEVPVSKTIAVTGTITPDMYSGDWFIVYSPEFLTTREYEFYNKIYPVTSTTPWTGIPALLRRVYSESAIYFYDPSQSFLYNEFKVLVSWEETETFTVAKH